MDFNVLSAFYVVPLIISAIGSLIEFRNCEFETWRHALSKAFFLAFRSMVPVLNIFSAILYLITCGTYTWKRSSTWKRSGRWKKSAHSENESL
jgi:predicted membrane protein